METIREAVYTSCDTKQTSNGLKRKTEKKKSWNNPFEIISLSLQSSINKIIGVLSGLVLM